MTALTSVQGEELRGLLVRRGEWGIVPADLPGGVTLRRVREHLAALGHDVREIERETIDGSVPALRLFDRADRARERRQQNPELVVPAAVCIGCNLSPVTAGDPCDACTDGHVVLTAVRVLGREQRAPVSDPRLAA